MFRFEERVHSFGTQLPPPTALLSAAERRLAGTGCAVVDTDSPSVQRLGQSKHSRQVPCKGVSAQAVGRIVGLLDSLLIGFERTHRGDRGEGFLLHAQATKGHV